jgi:hypothetical protein
MKPLVIGLVSSAIVFAIAVQRNKNKNPEKSYLLAALNVFLIPIRYFKLSHFRHGDVIVMDNILNDAKKSTGLSDFGDLEFVRNYKLVSELPFYKTLPFTNVGFITAVKEIELTVTRRLQMRDYLKSEKAVHSVPVQSPLFVFGLGRSGTTFVHRLLSLDPEVRSPLLWELILPVPGVKGNVSAAEFKKDREIRNVFIRHRIAERNFMGDNSLENLHEVGADFPEECLFALSDEVPLSFHYVYTTLLNLPTVLKGIPPNRIVAAYKSYKSLLQLLSYQVGDTTNPKRWVLKCPLHIFYLKQIAEVFPDAKIVW